MSQKHIEKTHSVPKIFSEELDIFLYKTKTICLPIILYKIQIRNRSKPLIADLKFLYLQEQIRAIFQDL